MAGKHQIQKLVFDIGASSEKAAKEELQLIESIIKRRILDTIEKVFDEQNLDKHILKIERLELDLGTIDIHQLDSEMEFKLRKSLTGELVKILEADPVHLQSLEVKLEAFENVTSDWLSQFLRTGTMPWWQEESMPSKEFIKNSILELHNAHPEKLLKLTTGNLIFPQFTKRLNFYSSNEFVVKLTGFHPISTEKRIDNILGLLKEQFNYTHLTFSQMWQTVVEKFLKTPPNSRNEVLLAKLIVIEVAEYLAKKEYIYKSEAILILKFGASHFKIDNKLAHEIENQYQKSEFKKASFSLLSPTTVKLTGKNIWFLDKLLSKESFIVQLQQKAFRFQFIKLLSSSEKQLALTKLIPTELKSIQIIYSFTELLVDQRKTSGAISTQLRFYTEDILLKNISTQALKTEDHTVIFQSIMAYLAELSAIPPETIFQEIKFSTPEVLTRSEWKDNMVQLEKNLKANEQKGRAAVTLKSGPDQIIQFLLTGKGGASLSPSEFQKLLLATIHFLLGAVKPSSEFKERDKYHKQLVTQIKSFSILEIALIVDRIKMLSLKKIEKDKLLKIILQDHNLSPIINQKEREGLLKWMENAANTDFLIQYILKFNRLPLNITGDAKLFLAAILLQIPNKIEKVAQTLDLASLNNLLAQLEELKKITFTSDQLAQIPHFKEKNKITSTEIKFKVENLIEKLKKLTQPESIKPSDLISKEEPSKKLSTELEKLAEKELDSDLYIQNAGIVLLSPYLVQIFNKLELLNKEGLWKDDKSQVKAVELIHFLTFGTEEMMEYTCVLNKLLVSMPISLPLETQISLSKEEKALCESLLTAVIANWPALKSSSIDNLRGSFLIREGRLSKHDDRYDLKVETKGYDMLIDKIPWSFKLIKYKWMKKPVFVDWR